VSAEQGRSVKRLWGEKKRERKERKKVPTVENNINS
jgi:hypothetical protein